MGTRLVESRPLEGLCFSIWDVETLEDFEGRSDLIRLQVLKDCTGYYFKNRLLNINKSSRPVKRQLEQSGLEMMMA